MSALRDALADAQANVARLEAAIAATTCRESGCDMVHVGGMNAGCGRGGCGCSVPVHVCPRCGDSDYGDNDEARAIRAACKEEGRS